MVEMICSPDFILDEPDQEHDPERVRCTPNMWRTFTKTAPESMDAMEYAQFMKQDGNQDFKNGNYALAIRKYDQALYMLVQLRQWGL